MVIVSVFVVIVVFVAFFVVIVVIVVFVVVIVVFVADNDLVPFTANFLAGFLPREQ